ncbi:alpha/beta fold hydrolase [Bacillus spongiae]|uniref:Alpha/beta fold hydrolase n=1 Tax=Bacillus spongiae TaxID=2683610 RepID=A0ABU8HDZ4_9BACI
MLSAKKEATPLIFVPGLFGSMSENIIQGTGKWHFGIASIVYDPFITALEQALGYQKDVDLFIAYYDWRKKVRVSFKEYLMKTIKKVKKQTNHKKVNIVAHSMGGLLTRAYIESRVYEKDIHQVILIGTPNSGCPPHYMYWTSGEKLAPSEPTLTPLFMNAYLYLFSYLYETDITSTIHQQFKGLRDLIPSEDYGNYLLKKGTLHWHWSNISNMKTKNEFLNSLNKDARLLKKRKVKLSLIAGIGQQTINGLKVISTSSKRGDGEVIGTLSTELGDGNTTVRSVFSIPGETYLLEGNHQSILLQSIPLLQTILGKKTTLQVDVPFIPEKDYLIMIVKGQGHLAVKNPLYQRTLANHTHFVLSHKAEAHVFHSHQKQTIDICKIHFNKKEPTTLHVDEKEQVEL